MIDQKLDVISSHLPHEPREHQERPSRPSLDYAGDEMFRITRPAEGDSCEIRLRTERLTAANATAFRNQVFDLIERGEDRLVVDFAAVTFVDSTAISALVGVLKRLGMRGEIALCGLSGSVAGMFRITRMDKVFPVFADCSAASAALCGRR
ncbi:STAS domain-containing protein [Paracoccus sp. TK19116]|uniref:STAS domain-containing protein n=1 Tax=Paracoccus albicereus TaxID=2922394 RepID=A0ABT1MQD5_9RHOB|nr:STAS domain-containing protein [Paracoccus albicereus]MCQ0970508.1 STAS domain-containing protein [Paracoccus albicereus]